MNLSELSTDTSMIPAEGGSIYSTPTRPAKPDYKIDHKTGCWQWAKGLTERGYPHRYAHRRYFERANPGVDITGLDVHHKCENVACVNPAHLEAVDHSTHLRRHKRAKSKLTEQQVREIRSSPLLKTQLAAKYGVGYGTINDIVRGKNWPGVEAPPPPMLHCGWCDEPMPGRRNKKYCSEICKARDKRRRRKVEAASV